MRLRHDTVALAVCALVGAAFGVLVRLGDGSSGAGAWLADITAPWIVVALAVGATGGRPRTGAARAVTCLVAAVLAKYAVQLGQDEIALAAASRRALGWGVAAVACGSAFGAVGARARDGDRAWAALPALALLAEALAFLTGALHGESAHLRFHHQPPAVAVFTAELCAAALLALWVGAGVSISGALARRPG